MAALEKGKKYRVFLFAGADSVPSLSANPSPIRFPWERAGWMLLAVLLLGIFPVVLFRAVNDRGGTDFPEFYAAGRHLLECGDVHPQSILKYYWPSLDVAWAGLAWMPRWVACTAWYACGCAAFLGLLASIYRWLLADIEHPRRRQVALAAGLLAAPLAMDHLCLGAFHILMIWLMIAGLARASRGRHWSGGLCLGLAVWMKLLPLIGVGYLLVKRKWHAAAIAVTTAVVVNLALCLPVFGPKRTVQLHAAWWQNQARGAGHRLLDSSEVADEDRLSNQSLAVVLRRVLTDMGLDASPERAQVVLAALAPWQLRLAYLGSLAILGLAVLRLIRRPGWATSEKQWSREIAIVALATLWVSPVAWAYHFTAATPALAIVIGRRYRHPVLMWSTAALWALAVSLLGWPLGLALGEMLWMTFFLALAVVGTANRSVAEETGDHGQNQPVQLRAAA